MGGLFLTFGTQKALPLTASRHSECSDVTVLYTDAQTTVGDYMLLLTRSVDLDA